MTLVQNEPKKIAMITGGAAPRLPVEYQEVEYIESSRTQVINTGVFPTTQTYTAELEIESTESGQEYWAFGIWGSTGFRAGQDSSGHWDTTYGASYDPSTYALNTRTKVTVSNSGKGVSGTTALGLFGMGESGSYSDARKGAYKMYYCKIWNSGTLIRDFVPCYRKLDSVIGMYDLVNDQFYTNIGTGTFTKGADVGGGEILIKKVMMRPGGVEKQIRPAGGLPAEYQKVEWIYGNGNSSSGPYINPGVSIESGKQLGVEADFEWLGSTNGHIYSFFSGTAGYPRFQNGIYGSNFQNAATGTNHTYSRTPSSYSSNTRYLMTASVIPNFNSSTGCYILAQHEDGSAVWRATAKIYYMKLYKDNQLVRDLIPCYRKLDGVIGLYDLVGNTFYTNSGNGTFTKGQDVN